MSEIRSNGLSSIKMAPVAADGGMAADADLVQLGVTFKDSASFVGGTPTLTNIDSEENYLPEETFSVPGAIVAKWGIINFQPSVMVLVLGGTQSVDANYRAIWEAPIASGHIIERSVQIINARGRILEIPRGIVSANVNLVMKKAGIDLIDISVTILQPQKLGVAPYRFINPAPAVPVITQQPVGGPHVVGDSINLTIAASGYTALMWKKDGVDTGVTTPILHIPAAAVANAGSYTVHLTGPGTPLDSAAAVITVA